MNILKQIDLKQYAIRTLEANIKFYQKEIKQNKNRYGILKIDCKNLIKTIDERNKTKLELLKLYKIQNKGA